MPPILDSIDKDQIVTIGNKPDIIKNQNGEEIRTEPYLRVMLDKLIRHNKLYIRTMPFPDKLAKIQEIYERLKFYGIVEIENRKIISEQSNKNPSKQVEVMLITWEVHPKLQVFREIEIHRKMRKE